MDSVKITTNAIFSFGKIVNGSFASVKLEHFSLTVKNPNNFCFVDNNIIKITKIIKKKSIPFFEGHIVKNLQAYFQEPICSEVFNIYWASELEQGESKSFYFNSIAKKIICLEDSTDNTYFFIPFIH